MEYYGIFTYIYHTNGTHVGKYTIHGAYGLCNIMEIIRKLWEYQQENQWDLKNRKNLWELAMGTEPRWFEPSMAQCFMELAVMELNGAFFGN